MKYFLLSLVTLTAISFTACKTSKTNDSVRIADSQNESKMAVDNDVAEFLVKVVDARMMGIKEGQLALQKGTTPEIVKYGKLMVKDQDMLLRKLQRLAASRNITLPAEISNDKKDGYADLDDKTGKSFDNKFIKMMRIDHERDIKDFKKAEELNDKGVSKFAAKYLPLIQSHLDKVNELKD